MPSFSKDGTQVGFSFLDFQPPTLTLDPATTTLSPGVQGTTKIADVTCTDSDDTVTTSVDNTKFEIVAGKYCRANQE